MVHQANNIFAGTQVVVLRDVRTEQKGTANACWRFDAAS
jgi:hypothetical protein